jgi:hypothetical protein
MAWWWEGLVGRREVRRVIGKRERRKMLMGKEADTERESV